MSEIKKILLGFCVVLVVVGVGCRNERETPNYDEQVVATLGEEKAVASVESSIKREETKLSFNIASGLGTIDPKTCRALLVGVDEYETLPPLEYASSDVKKIRDALLEIGLVAENIRLFISDGRVRERPSRERIWREFNEMLSETDADSTVLVAFSGHGFETENGAAAFCPEDVVVKNKEDGTPVVEAKTAILMSDVVKSLQNDDARFKMLVVDACREPASTKRAIGGKNRSFSHFDASGLAFLQSCGSRELSWEHPDVGGVFTHFFCEGLRGAAARENGGVTFLDACGYASRETQRFVADRRDAEQKPFFTFAGVVDFWLKAPTKETESVVEKYPEEYVDANCGVFKLIEPGSFTMGTCGLTPEEISDKFPGTSTVGFERAAGHKVTLTKPFYMAKYETTVREFKKFVDATGYVTSAEKTGSALRTLDVGEWIETLGINWRNPGFSQDSTHPVVCVSWNDATAYINWLNANAEYSEELGCKPFYRLPTEAEWEYACRAGTKTEFFWGTNEPKDGEGYLNAADLKTGDKNATFPFDDGYVATAPVGNFKPNPRGLYDMVGNVQELCLDWYAPLGEEPQIDPTGAADGNSRVIRGGSCRLGPVSARSNDRRYAATNSGLDDVGFRIVVDIEGGAPKNEPKTDSSASASTEKRKSGVNEATPKTSENEPSATTSNEARSYLELPEEYVDANGLTFRLIKPGTFTMGNAGLTIEEINEKFPGAFLRWLKDAERHKVTLTKPFYMAKYETTVAEFKKFVDATGYVTTAEKSGSAYGLLDNGGFGSVAGANWRNPSVSQDSTHPVVCVSWEDATAYIDWLNKNAEYSPELGCKPFYRLPTEAEWEYACRAGTQTEFFWGTNEPKDGEGYLNAADASGAPHSGFDDNIFPFNDGYVGIAPVGSFKPNAWGLHDMAGNAMEWCSDWFAPYKSEAQTNPTGPTSGDARAVRVARGGAWNLTSVWARSNDRYFFKPSNCSVDRGFRVVVDLSATAPKEETESALIAALLATEKLPEEYVDANGEIFKLIKPGVFTMGTCGLTPEEINEKYPGTSIEWLKDAPSREVTLTKPFYMAKYETTVAAFKKFVDATGYVTTAEKLGSSWGLREDGVFGHVDGANWRAPTIPQEPTHPVVCVSWKDATAYINWLNANAEYSEELGCKPFYRLPTEAEWEYACRAGTKTEFFWGTNEPKDGEGYLNAVDESGAPNSGLADDSWPFNDGYVGLAPVGSFKPNPFGLYDMVGNAMEWCSDWHAPYDTAPQKDPTGSASGTLRVLRGGAWDLGPVSGRSNDRRSNAPENRGVDTGFRVVVDLSAREPKSDLSATSPKEKTESVSNASKFPEEYVDANGTVFKLIQAGTFTMGNAGLTAEEIKEKYPNGILEHIEGAKPHKVTLTKPFYMAKYETTVAEFKKFVDATGYVTTAEEEGDSWGVLENDRFGTDSGANWRNPGFPQDSTHPVVHISWDDATAYINWLNANAKYSEELGCAPFYRLPTEAEWEYACRAGTKTEFFWGTNEPTDGDGYLNAADASGMPNGGAWSEIFGDVWLFNDGYVATAPVGSFKPNAWGLYDMAGNACEWCSDWFTSYESEPQTDPTGPATGVLRAMRGGSWCYSPVGCRSNSRFPPFPTHRSSDFGFRVVVERKR